MVCQAGAEFGSFSCFFFGHSLFFGWNILGGELSRPVESVQDFLIKLDMKPRMHLVEISIFSLNLDIVRLTKIMNRGDKNWAQF